MHSHNVDWQVIQQFDELAKEWWDPKGPMKPLHQLNPLRFSFVEKGLNNSLAGKRILDVGCGAGLFSEALAAAGAQVTAIDLSASLIEVAKQHAAGRYDIEYRYIAVEALSQELPEAYDALTCFELLEHVPHPDQLVSACARLVKPGGTLFFSTLNRHPKAFLVAILGAEYITKTLPKGTHHYADFIRPSELARWAEACGLKIKTVQGIQYQISKDEFCFSDDVSVNYLMTFERPL